MLGKGHNVPLILLGARASTGLVTMLSSTATNAGGNITKPTGWLGWHVIDEFVVLIQMQRLPDEMFPAYKHKEKVN